MGYRSRETSALDALAVRIFEKGVLGFCSASLLVQGLNMRPIPFSMIPTWLQVLRVLHQLTDDERVTLAAFRKHDEPAWHWAVAQRSPTTQRSGHVGHSPWIHLVNGRPARSIRQIAPLWIAQPDRWPITADELEQLALHDPHMRHRFEAAKRMADLLLHEHADWPWLRTALDLLHPLAVRPTDDMDDLPWNDGPRIKRPRGASPVRPVVPPPSPMSARAGQSSTAVSPQGSTRPTLRVKRPPPTGTP